MEVTISGRHFNLEPRYVAGPTELTEGEARALNQLLKENIRNNFAAQLKILESTGANNDTINQAFVTYSDQYKFSDRASERAPADKLSQMVRSMATDIIKVACEKNGVKYKDIPEETLQAALEAVLSTQGATLRAEAERRLATVSNISATILDQTLLSSG